MTGVIILLAGVAILAIAELLLIAWCEHSMPITGQEPAAKTPAEPSDETERRATRARQTAQAIADARQRMW